MTLVVTNVPTEHIKPIVIIDSFLKVQQIYLYTYS